MLLVAIPKSASTSLMHTLASITGKKAIPDFSFKENPYPTETSYLQHFHSDIRQLSSSKVDELKNETIDYKQHVFPSRMNIELLLTLKKVSLLRKPEDIVLAYRRSAMKEKFILPSEFKIDMNVQEGIETATRIGVLKDLELFFNSWSESVFSDDNIIIHYQELINKTHATIHKIEKFWNLPLSQNVGLQKKNYTRRSLISGFLHRIKVKTIKTFRKKLISKA